MATRALTIIFTPARTVQNRSNKITLCIRPVARAPPESNERFIFAKRLNAGLHPPAPQAQATGNATRLMKGKLARVGRKDLFGGALTLSNVYS
jgi:hypothetical protein